MPHSESDHSSIPEILARVRALFKRDERLATNRLWIEGIRNFIQAYDAQFPIETVIYSARLLKSDLAEMLIRRLGRLGVRRVRVSPEEFRSISIDNRASGIGAIARQRWISLENPPPLRQLCWLVIENLRSPGNLGTILRTAEATGVSGIIFVGSTCDPYDPATVRASMGGIFHLPLIRTTHDELQQWVLQHGVQVVGLAPEAEPLWAQSDLAPRVALAIGEERRGLSDRLRAICNTFVRLPMVGQADSLNVGVATGIMLYELVRRNQLLAIDAPNTSTP
ncbi:MAG: RNA methyltransferase [Planctomycetota bacterium]